MLFGFVHGLHFVPIQPVAITVAAIIVCLVLYFHFYCGRQCRLSVVDVFVIGIFVACLLGVLGRRQMELCGWDGLFWADGIGYPVICPKIPKGGYGIYFLLS